MIQIKVIHLNKCSNTKIIFRKIKSTLILKTEKAQIFFYCPHSSFLTRYQKSLSKFIWVWISIEFHLKRNEIPLPYAYQDKTIFHLVHYAQTIPTTCSAIVIILESTWLSLLLLYFVVVHKHWSLGDPGSNSNGDRLMLRICSSAFDILTWRCDTIYKIS